MDLKHIALVAVLVACKSRPPEPAVSAVPRALTATCVPARDFGAIPDDSIDDRAALQAACNCGKMILEAGHYDVVTPAAPRPKWLIVMPTGGCEIVGVGRDRTFIDCKGETGGLDWQCINVTAGAEIHEVTISGAGMTASAPNDQVPLLRTDGVGSVLPTKIHHNRFTNPGIGGDCYHAPGYDPVPWKPSTLYQKTNRVYNAGRSYETTVAGTSGTEGPSGTGSAIVDGTATWKYLGEGTAAVDRTINNIHITDNLFENCSRSGITLKGVHNCTISDNVFTDTWDQDIDGESGGNKGITDCEIADNKFLRGPHAQSSLALAPQDWTRTRIHHNYSDRGIETYGCTDCTFDHNVIKDQTVDRIPFMCKKNCVGLDIHHEHYEHNNVGLSAVLKFEYLGTVGSQNITIRDSTFIQHAPTTVLASIGTRGLYFRHNTVVYNGNVSRMAMDVQPSAGTTGVQTTDIYVRHSTFKSTVAPWQAILHLNGSGHGTGSFEVSDTWASAATRGVWCENVNATIGVQGPATYYGNTMPAPICGTLSMGGN